MSTISYAIALEATATAGRATAPRSYRRGVIVELPDHLHDAAVELWRDVGLTRPWNDPRADLERAVRGPSSTVLAWLEGPDTAELAGTVMVGHDGHRGWFYYLAVRPGCRGRGVGARLVAAGEAWLGDHVPKVQLMVRGENSTAAAFYEHLGYARDDVVVLSRRLG